MKAPLRSSYGTIGIMNQDGNAKNDNKYGLPGSQVRAVDKVAIKRPGSPQSWASTPRKASGSYEANTPFRRESTSSVATSIDGLNYQDLHRAAVINQSGSAQNSYSEPYIVEVGGQGTPHIVRISDIQEYPGAEERAKKEDERQRREREQQEQNGGHNEEEEEGEGEGERRPLLDGVKKMFSGRSE